MLKSERQQRILALLGERGRLVAAELPQELGVSAFTVRRDLDELADEGHLLRVHGGALARSRTPQTHAGRGAEHAEAKAEVGRAAAGLLRGGEVVIVDGGSTALAVVAALPDEYAGTFITHSPPAAVALARLPNAEVVVIGGVLEPRALVCTGAVTIEAYLRVRADVCFLGVWSAHAEHGISEGYFEEAEVRRTLLDAADRVVGLCTRDKLGTVAPFSVGQASALTHIATERGTPAALIDPFAELGIEIVRP